MQGSSPGSMPHQPGVRASLHYGIYNPRPGHHTRCHCRRGVVVVIYVGQLGYANCLAVSDGFGGSGNAWSSCAAASPYPAPSSPKMASSFHISRPAQTCRLPCRFGRPCALPDIEPVSRCTRRHCWCLPHPCAGVTPPVQGASVVGLVVQAFPPAFGFIALVALARSHWQCCQQHIVIAELASLPRLR